MSKTIFISLVFLFLLLSGESVKVDSKTEKTSRKFKKDAPDVTADDNQRIREQSSSINTPGSRDTTSNQQARSSNFRGEKSPKEEVFHEGNYANEPQAPQQEQLDTHRGENIQWEALNQKTHKNHKKDKVKTPKAEKPPKQPKVIVPTNHTELASTKAASHVFWYPSAADFNFLSTFKSVGLKKNSCQINQFNKIQGTQTGPVKNLCQLHLYNPYYDNQWQDWNNNSTETGRFRFFDNGTSCEYSLTWRVNGTNGTHQISGEQGTIEALNSQAYSTYKCVVSGKSDQSSWSSNIHYIQNLQGNKRGETFDHSYNVQSSLSPHQNETVKHEEHVENTIFLHPNQTAQSGQTFHSKYSIGQTKASIGSTVKTIDFNGNTTSSSTKWNKSKNVTEFVENYAEGQRYGSEHSKIKSDLSQTTVNGQVMINSGVSQERSRAFYKQTFGSNANNVDFIDTGNDRRIKTNLAKPIKNIDQPDSWNVTGTYVPPPPGQYQEPIPKKQKKKTPKQRFEF